MFEATIQSVMDEVDALRDRVDDHMQVDMTQARLLAQLVRIGRCVSLCEIGMSYGFSTLHLAAATEPMGGHVHTVDRSDKKVAAATDHLTRAGLIDAVTIHQGEALEVLPTIEPAEPFDFVFIDATKDESIDYFRRLEPKLAGRCILAADNTGNLADQMAPYVEFIRGVPGASSCDVPVFHGFELTLLER